MPFLVNLAMPAAIQARLGPLAAGGGPAPSGAPAAESGGLAELAAALGTPAVAGLPIPPAGGSGGDVRILGIHHDQQGQRSQDFAAAVLSSREMIFPDWPVRGPRTTDWELNHIRRNCGGPLAWHTKWRMEWKLDTVSDCCRYREFFCGVLETMVCYDQTKEPNLAAADLVCGQLQLIEEQQYEDSVAAGAEKEGKTNKVVAGTETYIVMGTQATRSVVCVFPALTEWLAGQLRAEAAVAKERREAREERASRR